MRSSEKNLEIEPERPRPRVLEVETHHVVEWEAASPAHLPEAGDPGLHVQQAPAVPDVVGLELVRDRGARADHRHLPSQDIEKLWKLVQAGLPQEPPGTRQSRIRGDLVDVAIRSGCTRADVSPDESFDVVHVDPRIIAGVHGAELQAREGDAILADSLLAKQDGPGRGQLDRECDGQENGREKDQRHRAAGYVDGALDRTGHLSRFVSLHEIRVELLDRKPRFILSPVFRKAVKRDANLCELFGTQHGLQKGGHPCTQGTESGLRVGGAQFCEYDAESGVLLVPAGDIRLSGRGKNGGPPFVSDIVTLAISPGGRWVG